MDELPLLIILMGCSRALSNNRPGHWKKFC